MSAKLMTPDHDRWHGFRTRLEGPAGCNFTEQVPGDPSTAHWSCGGGNDLSKSRAILLSMGYSSAFTDRSLEFFSAHGGHCDCEVLFNVEDSYANRKGEREQLTEPYKLVTEAIALLRDARDKLVKARAPMAAKAVRAALKSAEGAQRHASRIEHGPAPARRRS